MMETIWPLAYLIPIATIVGSVFIALIEKELKEDYKPPLPVTGYRFHTMHFNPRMITEEHIVYEPNPVEAAKNFVESIPVEHPKVIVERVESLRTESRVHEEKRKREMDTAILDLKREQVASFGGGKFPPPNSDLEELLKDDYVKIEVAQERKPRYVPLHDNKLEPWCSKCEKVPHYQYDYINAMWKIDCHGQRYEFNEMNLSYSDYSNPVEFLHRHGPSWLTIKIR